MIATIPLAPDKAQRRRKAELAKIHVAKKKLALDDDTYRSMLVKVTGRDSAGDLSQAQRTKVLDHLKTLGFKDDKRPHPRAGTRPADASPEGAKIRALWLALFQLGEVQDSREAAIDAYVKRMTGKDALRFVSSQRDVAKVIKTLRGWCERVGFTEPDAASVNFWSMLRERAGLDGAAPGLASKHTLIKVLFRMALARGLGAFANLEMWLLAHYRISDLWALSAHDADDAIERLGRVVRAWNKPEQRR